MSDRPVDGAKRVDGDHGSSGAAAVVSGDPPPEGAVQVNPAPAPETRLTFLTTGAARCLMIIVLIALAGLAAWIGVPDAVTRPLSLASQIVGLSYLLAGIAALISASALATRRMTQWWLRAMIVGGASGAYIALSVALAARVYRETLFWGLLALGVLSLSFVVLGGLAFAIGKHDNLSAPIKALGASVAVIIAASQLWYTSIYQPNNSDVGFDISSSVGRPQGVSRSLELVPVDVVVHNDSAFSAVLLTSMYTITGVGYGRAAPSRVRSEQASLAAARATGLRWDNPPGFTATHGHQRRALLAVGRVLIDGSYLRASGTTTLPLVVPVPTNAFQEIIVQVDLSYARQSRVTLSGRIRDGRVPSVMKVAADCRADVRREWGLAETQLGLLAHGRQVLVTNWCAPPDSGGIFSEVAQAPDAKRVHPIDLTRNNKEYGISFTARSNMFMLPSIQPVRSPR